MSFDWRHISVETLSSLDLDRLIEGVEPRECLTYGEHVSHLGNDKARWGLEQQECLRFVSATLSMTLRPDQPAEPFQPVFVFSEARSAIPADFPKAELIGLKPWVDSLHDPELIARFLDVLWVQGRSFPAAQGAVIAYLASALRLEHPKKWTPCYARLERALRLATSLGKGGVDLRGRVLDEVVAIVRKYRGGDPLYLSLGLIRLLLEFTHGDANEYAAFALNAAKAAEADSDFWRARDYHHLAAECHRTLGDAEAESAELREAAECLVKESALARTQPGRGTIAAASLLSDAVEAMRQVPGGRDRAVELHEQLIPLQQEAVMELKPVSASIDASASVQRALAAVRDKPLRDAILGLCEMVQPPSIQKLKEQVRKEARVAVLGSLMSSEVVNSRGRVIAKAPALQPDVDDTKDDGLRWRMFTNARLTRHLVVQAVVNPARQEIFATHGPSRQDVTDLIQFSTWIPPGHAESVMRALVAGFEGDMLIAGHLVPPQLEALVRHVVESRGGETTMLEPGGIQPERTLGALLDCREALEAFGADGIFELQDLLVDPLGTNLRNEVAHGLLDDSGLFGTDVLYAWWLLLRYCVLNEDSSKSGS